MDPHNRQEDNLGATDGTIDEVDTGDQDDDVFECTYVNAPADEVTGITSLDGTNALEGIDNMDYINQMTNMDRVASRKSMVDLKDTKDMQNTDEINNVDYLDSSKDIAYTDSEEDSYLVRWQNCHFEFDVAYTTYGMIFRLCALNVVLISNRKHTCCNICWILDLALLN